jgi:hypothetical protein
MVANRGLVSVTGQSKQTGHSGSLDSAAIDRAFVSSGACLEPELKRESETERDEELISGATTETALSWGGSEQVAPRAWTNGI